MRFNVDIGEGWEYEKGVNGGTCQYNLWTGPEPKGFQVLRPTLRIGAKDKKDEGVTAYIAVGNELTEGDTHTSKSSEEAAQELNKILTKKGLPEVNTTSVEENIESIRRLMEIK